MLTTIPPPIVLPKTNLLKIHPVPSSPSPANGWRRDEAEGGREGEREERALNAEAQNNFQKRSAEQCAHCHKMSPHIQCWAISFSAFSFILPYSGMQLLVICYGRFAAQWNPSGIGVIPLPPHWLSINEAISTNTFWCLWNHFWKGVFNDTSWQKNKKKGGLL